MSDARLRSDAALRHDLDAEVVALEARRARAPRIHALVASLWDLLNNTLDEAKRRDLEDTIMLLESLVDRDREVSEEDDVKFREVFGLGGA